MATSPRDALVYGRLSYAHLFTPQSANEKAEPKYSATILIPKTDQDAINRVQAAIKAAVDEAVARGTFKQAIDPTHTKYPPLRDGDSLTDNGEPRGAEYAGHWFIPAKASASRKPFVVDGQLQPIIDESAIYSGAYCNFAIQFYGYDNSGNKGISTSLIGVQKVRDGEPLGGPRLEAADVFSTIAGTQPAPNPGGFTQPAAPAANPQLGF